MTAAVIYLAAAYLFAGLMAAFNSPQEPYTPVVKVGVVVLWFPMALVGVVVALRRRRP